MRKYASTNSCVNIRDPSGIIDKSRVQLTIAWDDDARVSGDAEVAMFTVD